MHRGVSHNHHSEDEQLKTSHNQQLIGYVKYVHNHNDCIYYTRRTKSRKLTMNLT